MDTSDVEMYGGPKKKRIRKRMVEDKLNNSWKQGDLVHYFANI